ncbi:EAL domain-containing protein [Marinimicrococcus flavescens]|uniref:EAL domain-containing protein n=1 Tax=Marinimicrococcus flavescens TaxID=3031815 RepID=A0AAP3XS99_9PROT|nr:EAL domain-containing protein [Marinimicrococcus flavescens]
MALKRNLRQRQPERPLATDEPAPIAHLPEELRQPDIDFAFVLAGDGTTLHGALGGRALAVTASGLLGKGLDDLLAAPLASAHAVASGFVLTASGPALVAVAPEPAHSDGQRRVVGEQLDPFILGELERHLGLPGLRFAPEAPVGAAAMELHSRLGTPLGVLAWDEAAAATAPLLPAWAPPGLLLTGAAGVLAWRALRGGRKRRLLPSRAGWIETELREALQRGELELFYQPQVELGSGRLLGAEALLRWLHPTRGSIPPSLFVPVAENAGLMPEIGRMVLRRAAAEAAGWGGLKLAVNVSPLQFRERDLVAEIRRTLAATGLPARCLELEITESALLDDPVGAAAMMAQLRKLGIGIAIDDFGTGYSSLSHLHRFPFDKIKLDRSFTEQILEQPQSRTVVEAVARLARELDARLCAEGVEREEQAALLGLMGFEEAQGFFYGRPMAAADLRALLVAPRGNAA